MNVPRSAPVVVGVDGTESARRAVRLAAAEAVLRNRPLRVVHAHIWPVLRVAPGRPQDGPLDGGLRRRAEAVVEGALAEVARSSPKLAVSGEVVDGASPAVLLRESRTSALLVVGHRGLRALSGVLVGSVAVQVSAQAHCPVLVTLGDRERDAGPVVVGVDGTHVSERAIGFAFEEAALRQTSLVAVHAANGGAATGRRSEHAVDEWLAAGRERFPQVPVTCQVIRGRAARVLIDESARAQLVVTGALGRGGLTGLVRGSVSQAVLRDSHCPLAIVRREQSAG
ncbi:MAG TPA: universal stress protein [Micromonosporaceae bacterium]|nr:universal stress protein [Micromonosporaceae bacterium]